jgi:hypothetical protein
MGLETLRAGWIKPVQVETLAVPKGPERLYQAFHTAFGHVPDGVSDCLHGRRYEQHHSEQAS